MRARTWVGVSLAGGFVAACSSASFSLGAASDAGGSSDGKTSGRADGSSSHHDGSTGDDATAGHDTGVAIDGGSTCGTESPKTDPGTISDACGVFVAPIASGGRDETGHGKMAAPYLTISYAVAQAGRKRVYVCNGAFAEHLVIKGAVEIYGGLACPLAAGSDAGIGGVPSWSYTGKKADVAPVGVGYALDVEDVDGAHFEDLSFTAKDATATTAGSSSIAVLVNGSSAVSFVRVAAVAGAGADGLVAATPPSNACTTSLAGLAATSSSGALPVSCTCPAVDEMSHGGSGGNITGPGGPGSCTPSGPAIVGEGAGGKGAASLPASCGNGTAGAAGLGGAGGAVGGAGKLESTGWAPVAGDAGAPGDPGQGGGGGGGEYATYGGGGGGVGGCGGSGGTGGGGGGASLAIAVIQSSVSLTAVTLSTSTGGAGAPGAPGESGQAGGVGGSNGSLECFGGAGGPGAGGGGGGGSAGGPSVGIGIATTTNPSIVTVDEVQVTPPASLTTPSSFTGGTAGHGGAGGAAGVPASGTTGATGAQGGKTPGGNGADGVAGAVEAL